VPGGLTRESGDSKLPDPWWPRPGPPARIPSKASGDLRGNNAEAVACFGLSVSKRRRFFENWIEEEEKSAAKLWACTATPVVVLEPELIPKQSRAVL
jgi:hypothetical protein